MPGKRMPFAAIFHCTYTTYYRIMIEYSIIFLRVHEVNVPEFLAHCSAGELLTKVMFSVIFDAVWNIYTKGPVKLFGLDVVKISS